MAEKPLYRVTYEITEDLYRAANCMFYEKELVCLTEKSQISYDYDQYWKMMRNKDITLMLLGNRRQPLIIILPRHEIWEKCDEQMRVFLRKKCINI